MGTLKARVAGVLLTALIPFGYVGGCMLREEPAQASPVAVESQAPTSEAVDSSNDIAVDGPTTLSTYGYQTTKKDKEAEYKVISVDIIDDGTDSKFRIYTVVHRPTNVMYTWIKQQVRYTGVTMQMLVNADGTPLLYDPKTGKAAVK